MPPASVYASVKPCSGTSRARFADCWPAPQTTTTGRALKRATSPARVASASAGMLRAPASEPAANVLLVADVDDDRVAMIDQLRRLERAERRVAAAAPEHRPQQQAAADERERDEEEVVVEEGHGDGRAASGRDPGTSRTVPRRLAERDGAAVRRTRIIKYAVLRAGPGARIQRDRRARPTDPCTHSSCCATANRPGTARTASPAGPTST